MVELVALEGLGPRGYQTASGFVLAPSEYLTVSEKKTQMSPAAPNEQIGAHLPAEMSRDSCFYAYFVGRPSQLRGLAEEAIGKAVNGDDHCATEALTQSEFADMKELPGEVA